MQNILKEKELILSKWVQGASSDMKYINPRRRPYADVDNLVWQWFHEYSSCGVHITGKLIQHTALQLAKALGNEKFSASNGWLESWQRRHNVKLSALYEAHKSKPTTDQAELNLSVGSDKPDNMKPDNPSEAPSSEAESFFKSGNDVIMETVPSDETSESRKHSGYHSVESNFRAQVSGTQYQVPTVSHQNKINTNSETEIGIATGFNTPPNTEKVAGTPLKNENALVLQEQSEKVDDFNFNTFKTESKGFKTCKGEESEVSEGRNEASDIDSRKSDRLNT